MDQIFCFAPSINPPMEPVVSRTKQTSMRGFLSGISVLAKSVCEQAMNMARSIVFMWFGLVGDFVNGVVEREQDVSAERQPRRGLRMFLEEIEIIVGVKLEALAFRHVLRAGIDPL